MKIFISSKVKHAPKWRKLRDRYVPIISTWIDEAGPGESMCFKDLWKRCVSEASSADALLLYVEEGDHLKGALVEVGAALSNEVPVYVVGTPDGSWINHYNVTQCKDLDDALTQIGQLGNKE